MSGTDSPSPHLPTGAQWRKSSYSGGNDDCVEVAGMVTRIAIRDSKKPGLRPAFAGRAAWNEFVAAITEGTIR